MAASTGLASEILELPLDDGCVRAAARAATTAFVGRPRFFLSVDRDPGVTGVVEVPGAETGDPRVIDGPPPFPSANVVFPTFFKFFFSCWLRLMAELCAAEEWEEESFDGSVSLIFNDGWTEVGGGAASVRRSALSALVGDRPEALEILDDVVGRASAVLELLVHVHLPSHTAHVLMSIPRLLEALEEVWEALSSTSSRAWV